MQEETVELRLDDRTRPKVHLTFNVHCGDSDEVLLTAVRRYEPTDIARMVTAELRDAITERVRTSLGHFAHDALISKPSLREILDLGDLDVADGLVQVTRLLSATVEADPNRRRIEDAQSSGELKIQETSIEADVEDAIAVRKQRRENMLLQLSDRQLLDLSREIGVPFVYLRDRDLYREQLQMRAKLFKKALTSESFPRLAQSMGMSTPDLNALVAGIAPEEAAQLPQATQPRHVSRLRFDPRIDEILEEVGVSEEVAGSSLYSDQARDGRTQSDVVLVSMDPGHLRSLEGRIRPIATTRLGLPDTFWHYVDYEDDLGRFIERYLPAVLPRRALQGVSIRVSELVESGPNLKIRLNVQGASLSDINGSLVGFRGRQIKQLQQLLPYRRIEYVE
ncbi:hypothetical protein [Knoellia subterranea]|nr:hypothetical protein [Knoellia subterranea]